MIETFDPESIELYNLMEDIGETSNLAEKRPDLTQSLHQQLEEWRLSVGARLMEPNPDYDPDVIPAQKSKKN